MKLTTLAAAAASLFLTGIAHADIIFFEGPGNFTGDTNVQFNEKGLTSTGTTVEGITNQSPMLINFYDAGQSLDTTGGQRITSSGSFNQLSITQAEPGSVFTSLILEVNAITDGMITFTVEQAVGSPVSATFNIEQTGQNFFRIQSINGQLITKVSFTSTSKIQDVGQFRIGGQAVPEPGTFVALGLGALALARKRRSRAASK